MGKKGGPDNGAPVPVTDDFLHEEDRKGDVARAFTSAEAALYFAAYNSLTPTNTEPNKTKRSLMQYFKGEAEKLDGIVPPATSAPVDSTPWLQQEMRNDLITIAVAIAGESMTKTQATDTYNSVRSILRSTKSSFKEKVILIDAIADASEPGNPVSITEAATLTTQIVKEMSKVNDPAAREAIAAASTTTISSGSTQVSTTDYVKLVTAAPPEQQAAVTATLVAIADPNTTTEEKAAIDAAISSAVSSGTVNTTTIQNIQTQATTAATTPAAPTPTPTPAPSPSPAATFPLTGSAALIPDMGWLDAGNEVAHVFAPDFSVVSEDLNVSWMSLPNQTAKPIRPEFQWDIWGYSQQNPEQYPYQIVPSSINGGSMVKVTGFTYPGEGWAEAAIRLAPTPIEEDINHRIWAYKALESWLPTYYILGNPSDNNDPYKELFSDPYTTSVAVGPSEFVDYNGITSHGDEYFQAPLKSVTSSKVSQQWSLGFNFAIESFDTVNEQVNLEFDIPFCLLSVRHPDQYFPGGAGCANEENVRLHIPRQNLSGQSGAWYLSWMRSGAYVSNTSSGEVSFSDGRSPATDYIELQDSYDDNNNLNEDYFVQINMASSSPLIELGKWSSMLVTYDHAYSTTEGLLNISVGGYSVVQLRFPKQRYLSSFLLNGGRVSTYGVLREASSIFMYLSNWYSGIMPAIYIDDAFVDTNAVRTAQ
jgi:hypothetical protein